VSADWSRRRISDFELAVRYYELGHSVDELAAALNVDQSTIRRKLSQARKEGLVRTLVVPSLNHAELASLEQDVRYKFELEDVVLVPGREDILDMKEETAPKEAMVLSIAQAAARYLEEHLTNRDTLLVPWGRMANYIARQLRAPRPLPGLTVVPMVGVLALEHNPYDANILAASFAAKFGGRSFLLPAPALVEKEISGIIEGLPLVQRVKTLYDKATVAIVPLASPDPERSTVVRMGLLSEDTVRSLVGRGAVGEIASHWWFDLQGRIVAEEEKHALGLGLDGLSRMVARRARVIAVVGASRERVLPLKVALNHCLVNTLITDHITARELLYES
jgi:DNA-binding transcriptional regulator LsrR (DeoR family)